MNKGLKRIGIIMAIALCLLGIYGVCRQTCVLHHIGQTVSAATPSATPASTATSKTSTKATTATKKQKIAIDAGHQAVGDSSTEAVGPGSATRKAKVAGGASGVATGVAEYQLNLSVAKKLQNELESRGYEVYMIRSRNKVNISNKKRAKLANKSGADIYIRIHADSSDASSVRGASGLYPSKSNPYVSKLSAKSQKLTKKILNKYCKATGIRNRGLVARDDLTGTNWSKIPVTLIEMGFMSNASEDRLMEKSSMQRKMARGMADGIDAYFGN